MMEVFVVNAFCYQGNGGNAAVVVLSSHGLERKDKMKIAKELGFSETVFVSESKVADYKLEYFTPKDEVELCGHATIATFSLLNSKGLQKGIYTIETKSGLLEIEIGKVGRVFMQQCCPAFFEKYPVEEFKDCLPIEYYNSKFPIQAVSTGLKDILFPVDTVEHLREMKPDFSVMARLNEKQGVVGIHAFALTEGKESIAECRNFAPLYDIDEESATGTSNCALACYLSKYYKKDTDYKFLQGVSMNKPSDIMVKLDYDEDKIHKAFVGGVGIIKEKRAVEF